jgi:RNA polymerase sigma-70 factor, ECF subfamily
MRLLRSITRRGLHPGKQRSLIICFTERCFLMRRDKLYFDVPVMRNLRIYRREEKKQGGRATIMLPNASPQDLSHGQEALPPFETLYDRFHVQVYRYLHAHLKDEHDAADLMQQVFFQAWRQRQSYEPSRGSVATWLLSIAHHRLVDFYRLSRPSISWEAVPEITTMDQNPEAHIIETETVALIKRLLEALPRPEQELLALRFAAGLSSAEIALIIGKSEAATKKQLTRLLHRLREQYRRQDLETPLPDLLEPTLPTFVEVLHQIYAAPLPAMSVHDVRQYLLELIHPVSS